MLKETLLQTPLGEMLAISDDRALCLLEFTNRTALDAQIQRLLHQYRPAHLSAGETPVLQSIQKELEAYFLGTLKIFKTPVSPVGSNFQRRVWQTLQNIPYGNTISYLEEAQALNHPKAFRAVAGANAKNPLTLIIPCHRVIRHDKTLGGYAAGLERKTWLLQHERQYA